MKTAPDIQSMVNNIKYYSQKIVESAKQQLDIDFKQGEQSGMNSAPGSTRFECLGAITGACSYINMCCTNIELNLDTADKQDEKLFAKEEEEIGEAETR